MLRAHLIDPVQQETPAPPGLLVSLAARGIRILDSRRWLLLQGPAVALRGQAWAELERELQPYGAALQNTASLIEWTRRETPPALLAERILDLPEQCLPTVIEALGGAEGLDRLERSPLGPADMDLCYAAFLQGITYQVDHDLDEDEPDTDSTTLPS